MTIYSGPGVRPLASSQSTDNFADFVKQNQQTVFRFAYSFFQNREDAMEVVQETFIKLQGRLGLFNTEGNLNSWLYRLTHNLCIDHYRKFHKKRKDIVEISLIEHSEAAPGIGPAGTMETTQMQEWLAEAMRSLPTRQFEIFQLRHHQGLKLEEISASLNISLGTVKTLHHRALKNIRKFLAKHNVGQP